MPPKEVADKYKKHELRDHIYNLPDTYIGSIEPTPIETWIYDDDSKRMIKKTLTIVPGLYKIFDEVLVNAIDQAMRLKAEIANGKEDVRPLKMIKINVDKATGTIEVTNDGDGIDIEKHPTYNNVWIPELIFGELLTSTNYDANEEKLWGGKNGYGAKLANIFSKSFTVETVDHRRKKFYKQTFTENMTKRDKPTVKACSKAPYTKITFTPDYERFAQAGLTDDMYNLFRKRVYDASACTDTVVTVSFNDAKIDVKNFEKYADLYIGTKEERPRVYEACSDRWEVLATYSEGSFDQVSFVNGINTLRGGKHVDSISSTICKKLVEMVASKKKKEVKVQHIKDNLMIFVKCLVVNPAFDSQSKETLTTQPSKFGSKCDLSDKFFDKLYKSGIIEKAVSLTEFHDTKKMAKTDGKKVSRVLIPNLDDANRAGTKDSALCTLILTEGLSAKTMAIAGLSVVGRDHYGVFPLKGKIMNVKDANVKKIMENEEISNIKKILGLEQGKEYKSVSDLRYGHVMILADQDVDGSHIKGLLFNVFQSLWPSLYKIDGFLVSMLTPIVKAIHRNGETKSFYNLTDFDHWQKEHATATGWITKYYKGLGTSKAEEAKDYFRHPRITEYHYNGATSDESMDLAFNKKRADDRKAWLMKYDRNKVLDYSKKELPYEEFVNKDLIHFSNYDLERSINNLCDGLKVSTRKILFGCFKKKLFKDEIKVAQLSGYVSEHSAYHHGEMSLQQAIVGMAQKYVGTNNVNLLMPNGQFGTRIQGGSDAASARYIFTLLSPLARTIYRVDDNPILKYMDDDGMPIEPEHYIPILPMVLANGALGIGTGFSTNVPCFNPADLVEACRQIIKDLDAEVKYAEKDLASANNVIDKVKIKKLHPWYLGFKGTIIDGKEGSYISKGVYKWLDDTTVEITELPIGTWTEDYKNFLMGLIAEGSTYIKDFENRYTDLRPNFILKMYPGAKDKLKTTFETEFKLASSKNLSLNNMHLYNNKGAIHKYKTVADIIREWAKVRLDKYSDRKAYQIKTFESKLRMLSAKVRFIKEIIEGTLKVMNTKMKDVEEQLVAKKYPKLNEEEEGEEEVKKVKGDGGYTYLTKMPIHHLTYEKKSALEEDMKALEESLEGLRAKSIQHIWADELDEFNVLWESHVEEVESEYSGSKMEAPAKKRAAPKKK